MKGRYQPEDFPGGSGYEKYQHYIIEACIGVLGIQDTCHFTSRDIGYYPSYFQGYGILGSKFSLLPGILKIIHENICQFIRDICLFTSRDMGYWVPPILASSKFCQPRRSNAAVIFKKNGSC